MQSINRGWADPSRIAQVGHAFGDGKSIARSL